MLALDESVFFIEGLNLYIGKLVDLLNHVIKQYESIPSDISYRVSRLIWNSNKYISGSTANKIPYEIVHALNEALMDWSSDKHIITTALVDDPDFHFHGTNPGDEISKILSFPFDIKVNLIQIALPKIYRHRYLNCMALYHELGHYIDSKYRITRSTYLFDDFIGSKDEWVVDYSHRSEFFADLFAASYVGSALSSFLVKFAGEAGTSDTHPATKDREKVIESFLAGEDSIEIGRISKALKFLKLPELKARFQIPSVDNCFNNIRPCRIESSPELHGIIPAAWQYLENTFKDISTPWDDMEENQISSIVNDLVEKSVRNLIVKNKWEYATSS